MLSRPNPSATFVAVEGFPDLPRIDWAYQAEIRWLGSISVRIKRMLSNAEIYEREVNPTGDGWMGDWVQIATATPPAVYDLPLAAGMSRDCPTRYWKTQEGIVFLSGSVVCQNGNFTNQLIAALPEGFRPANELFTPATITAPAHAAALRIETNGNIFVIDISTTGHYLKFMVFFPAA